MTETDLKQDQTRNKDNTQDKNKNTRNKRILPD